MTVNAAHESKTIVLIAAACVQASAMNQEVLLPSFTLATAEVGLRGATVGQIPTADSRLAVASACGRTTHTSEQ